MPLDDLIDVQISIQGAAISRTGFGVPLVLDQHSNFAERIKFYSSIQELEDDGFISSDPIWRAVNAMFSQEPSPPRVAVGRRETAVASVDRVEVLDDTDGTYTITINGEAASFVAALQTTNQIRDGLVAAINALLYDVGVGTATATPSGTTEIDITADTAGIPLDIQISAPTEGGLAFIQNVDVTGNDAGAYQVDIGSVVNVYNADGLETATDIREGLRTLLNADTSETGVTAVIAAGDSMDLQSQSRVVVAVSAPSNNLTLTLRTLNVGVPEDLTAISDENDDWYALATPANRDDATILATAQAIESRRKIYFAQSSDDTIRDTVYDPGNIQDIGAKLRSLSLLRTALWFATDDTNMLAASMLGRGLPEVAGSITWKFKTLAGVAPDDFTTTQRVNLRGDPLQAGQGKAVNIYLVRAGVNTTEEGTVASGQFIDVIRGIDQLEARIQENSFAFLKGNPKVPFTQTGINSLANAGVRASLRQSVQDGLIADSRVNAISGEVESPAYTVTPPRVQDISATERQQRIIPASNPIRFEATLAGAIHAVAIRGTVSA